MDKEFKIFKNGSTWIRADFHLHTKADKEFVYKGEESFFVSEYVNKLSQEKIGIATITNHNKFDLNEYKELYKVAGKQGIYLLPGVELSVNDGANGIHCLISFDRETWISNSDDYINQFLTSAFEGVHNSENENTRCNYNFEHLLEKLEEHRIKGRNSFIVLAHVEENSGFFNELKGGRITQLAKNKLFKRFVLGLQKLRTYDKIDDYHKWFGDTLPAFVEGSDCKTIEKAGMAHKQDGVEKKTYIKIGDYNFEAVKYALSDAEYRIKAEKPIIKNSYIKSIHFEGGKLDGQIIDFSPELNNLIGIRGSGKSSILEIIRYTLCIDLPDSSVADLQYKKDLIKYILGSGGKVTLIIADKEDREYRIEKIYGQKETIYDENGDLCDCPVSAVFDIPIYFGQKDLSNKKDDFESDFLKRITGGRLETSRHLIDAKNREVTNIILEMKKSQDLKPLKEETEVAIKTAEQKKTIFREKGVEDKLKLQTQFENDANKLIQSNKKIANFRDELQSLVLNYEEFFSKSISGSEQNKDIFEKANVVLNKAKENFEKLKTILGESSQTLQQFEKIIQSFNVKKEGMKEEFAKIKRELNSDTINPDIFIQLNRTIETSRLKLKEIDKLEAKKQKLNEQLLIKLNELNDLWLGEYQILKKEIEKVNQANENLQIDIEFKGQRNKFKDILKNTFRGTGIRESVFQTITEKFQDFIEIYRNPELLRTIVNENQRGSFNERFLNNFTELLTYKVKDRVTINYKGKPLSQHSLGQRASALILFLLAQKDNDVLILDQPEDDLDNQTIYNEVIKELVRLKGDMQFIFATHNANIPVLGDSEKVLSCNFEGDKINIIAGSIDSPSIQKSIVSIMEGGEEAFNKRKEIYNIWNR